MTSQSIYQLDPAVTSEDARRNINHKKSKSSILYLENNQNPEQNETSRTGFKNQSTTGLPNKTTHSGFKLQDNTPLVDNMFSFSARNTSVQRFQAVNNQSLQIGTNSKNSPLPSDINSKYDKPQSESVDHIPEEE